jgi:hypothetical protein
MEMIRRLFVGLFLSALLISCFNPPEFPIVPQIEFKKADFIDEKDPSVADTLVLYLDFKDGDGDIGLSDADLVISESTAKYAERVYFDKNGKKWVIGDLLQLRQSTNPNDVSLYNSLLKFNNRKKAPFDSLPSFTQVNNCLHWQILQRTSGNSTVNLDTVYYQLNPNHYNIFVDFFINDGRAYKEYDFKKEFCTTYDGRLPILSKDITRETPLQGTIRYAMPGTGFKFIFTTKPIKIRVRIQDRKLNKSNEVETDAFTLQSISK